MLRSQLFVPTMKQVPADASLASHQLMLRAGMIRRLASGLYTWLPVGLMVLRNVEAIIRDEMCKTGAQEVSMPIVQPGELWAESGRLDKYGKELLRFVDRHDRTFCLGPTHEEVVTDLLRGEVKSYKQLPMTLYQIQTKFRDEIRPRFGVMRAREFMMKDAYSFHDTQDSLKATYATMRGAYVNVFNRLGLDFRVVMADSGSIGGEVSEEFHVIADSGEDVLAYAETGEYAANVEKAEAYFDAQATCPAPTKLCEKITCDKNKLAELPAPLLKTVLVAGKNVPAIALVLRAEHDLNEIKIGHLEAVATPFRVLEEARCLELTGVSADCLGPLNLSMPIIVDREAARCADFMCGANEAGHYYIGVNWVRDLPVPTVADIRLVCEGDLSPDKQGRLLFARGIEVGHIFQLGNTYSQALNASVLNAAGKHVPVEMGCYGLGVSRIVAASIEQNHDDRGIIWPGALAPFQVVIVPLGLHKSYRVKEAADTVYASLQASGISVLYDDRKERPGAMFADADLLGMPHRVVISERNLDQAVYEYKARCSAESESVSITDILTFLQDKIGA